MPHFCSGIKDELYYGKITGKEITAIVDDFNRVLDSSSICKRVILHLVIGTIVSAIFLTLAIVWSNRDQEKALEVLLNNPLGTAINYGTMRFVSNNWKQRYIKKKNNPYKAKEDISKHHPNNFQHQVITKINEQYSVFEKKHGINITKEIA